MRGEQGGGGRQPRSGLNRVGAKEQEDVEHEDALGASPTSQTSLHCRPVACLAFSPLEGGLRASGSWDKTARYV